MAVTPVFKLVVARRLECYWWRRAHHDLQLSQVIGVAVFGSLFLSLAAHSRAHASAAAVSTVGGWLSALCLLAVVGAVLLAQTVRDRRVARGSYG